MNDPRFGHTTDTLRLKLDRSGNKPVARPVDRRVDSSTLDLSVNDRDQTDTLRLNLQKSKTRQDSPPTRHDHSRTQSFHMKGGKAVPKTEDTELTKAAPINSLAGLDDEIFVEFFEAVYDAVLITERDGRIIRTNGRAKDFFECTEETFCSINVLQLIEGADDEVLQATAAHLRKERHVFIEGFCKKFDSEFFPADITVNLLHVGKKAKLCFFIRNITLRNETEVKLANAREQLLQTAHSAGMAEIATAVLHDIGNVLNSVNVSCGVILEHLNKSKVHMLMKVDAMLHRSKDVSSLLTEDPKGKKFPELLHRITQEVCTERAAVLSEATNLRNNINAIKDVISTQQTYAKAEFFIEEFELTNVIEDALSIHATNAPYLQIDRSYGETPAVRTQRAKLVMILMNILANARDAVSGNPVDQRHVLIDTGMEDENVFISITDNGEGISTDNLTKIFTHGFTTKPDGHGFGLHTCANLVTEMGGRLIVESEGQGCGASFTLVFPAIPPEKSA
ncbi:MAG TPA: hypothetical protein DCR55_11595 [Lentisphaeria bacterium]|nr:hypothetical protein [Lentisphaeria bacterium]